MLRNCDFAVIFILFVRKNTVKSLIAQKSEKKTEKTLQEKMPRGKYVNHKGSSRHFTSPEQLQLDCDEVKSSGSDKEAGAGTSSSGQDLTDPGQTPASESESEDNSDDSGSEMRNAKKG